MSITRRNVRHFLSSSRLLVLLIAAAVCAVVLQRIPMLSHASVTAEVLIGAVLVVTGALELFNRFPGR